MSHSILIGGKTKQFEQDETVPSEWAVNQLGNMVPAESAHVSEDTHAIVPSRAADAWISIQGAKINLCNMRPYLKPLYDLSKVYPEGSRNITVMAGRQVEKCVVASEPILMSDGSTRQARHIKPGDRLASMVTPDIEMGIDTVVWVSGRILKKCLCITTNTGRKIRVADTHPIRVPGAYVVAENLRVTQHIAIAGSLGARRFVSGKDKRISNILVNEVLDAHRPEGINGVFAPFDRFVTVGDFDKRIDMFVRKDYDNDHFISDMTLLRDADVSWETIVSIEDLGRKVCVDMEMDKHSNFAVNGVITHNSCTLAAMSIVYGAMYPYLNILYVTPREEQVKVYSRDRFASIAKGSKIIAERLISGKEAWQVFNRKFTNESTFYFRAALTGPDASRGITAIVLVGDEMQEIDVDFIPVLEQCQARWMRHPMRKRVYTGTPLSSANTLALMYQESCQFRWKIRCSCGFWNDPMVNGVNMLTEDGYVCAKCKGKVNPPKQGVWVPERPELLNVRWGFHLPQLIVPFKEAREIVAFRDDPKTSDRQFLNEAMGIPCDVGRSLLSREDVIMACSRDAMLDPMGLKKLSASVQLFGGIDYGMSRDDGSTAYTFLCIGCRDHQFGKRFKVLHMKRLTAAEGDLSKLEEWLDRYFRHCGVKFIGADEGFGTFQNTRLVNQYGWSPGSGFMFTDTFPVLNRYQYTGQSKTFMTYHQDTTVFSVNRSQTIVSIVDAIRRRNIEFPSQVSMEFAMNDLTALRSEHNDRTGRTQYVHSLPDDGFHALAYAYLTFLYHLGQLSPEVL